MYGFTMQQLFDDAKSNYALYGVAMPGNSLKLHAFVRLTDYGGV
jgi:hypothetical protein